LYTDLPPGLKLFVGRDEWDKKILEIKENTTSPKSSVKRFYDWFNMFRIVKYMNTVNSGFFGKQPVMESASKLLNILGINLISNDPVRLLKYFRDLEKGS
jgi:hypothetical protein